MSSAGRARRQKPWIAGSAMVVAYLISGGFIYLFSGNFLTVIFSLLFLAIAVYTASSRLR